MEEHGTKFIHNSIPTNIEKLPSGRKLVTWENPETKEIGSEEFDTILFAIGRTADTKDIGLETVGVEIDNVSKKIIVKDNEQSSVENIYAIGDCAKGRPELTPTAIMAGRYLARRLFAASSINMNYKYVATAVFTPLEYGACGWSEEDAIKQFGQDNIEVYHTSFKPLEWNFLEARTSHSCYVKQIVDKSDNEKILGLHYLGPNGGEVIQGYAVAIKMGVTKAQFDDTVGIHPTVSEELLGLSAKKSEGDAEKSGC